MSVTSGFRLAVDFGTTHTVAVLAEPGGRVRNLLFDGSPLLPSAVFAADDGRLHAGVDAVRLAPVAPAAFEPNPKTRIDEATVLLGSREYAVVDLFATVLARVAAEAARVVGGPPAECVLTHPAAWGPHRRQVLVEAARRAGLTASAPPRLLAEPQAAAGYFTAVLGHAMRPGQPLAVFDFGGGTLDVAVVRWLPDGFEVSGLGGLDDLGGRDLDAVAYGLIGTAIGQRDPATWHRLAAPATPEDLSDRLLLWQEARQVKEMLSRAPAAPVQVPGSPIGLHLTREEFERAAAPLVDRAVEETARVLAAAGAAPADLAGVFLVGGASRVPLVAQRLHRRLGIAPTTLEQPETVVATGAVPRPAPVFTGPVPTSVPVSPPGAAGPQPVAGPQSVAGPPRAAAPVPVPATEERRAARGRRGRATVVVAALLAVVAVAGVVAYRQWVDTGGPDAGPSPGASASAGSPDPEAVLATVPNQVRDLARPWAPVLQSCGRTGDLWFATFGKQAALDTAVHCTLRPSAEGEQAGVVGVSFFVYESESRRTGFRTDLDKAETEKVTPPDGGGVGIARQIQNDGKTRISVSPARCVVFWDSATTLGAGVVASNAGTGCVTDSLVGYWRTRAAGR